MSWTTRVGGCVCVAALVVGCAKPESPQADAGHAATSGQSSTAAQRCARLDTNRITWPDSSTRITNVTWHDAGSTVQTFMGPQKLPANCEVTAVMKERVGAGGQNFAIHFKVRLPENWKQRLYFQGGGGTNGNIGDAIGRAAPGQPSPLERGYAVVSQDSGHDNARNSVPELGGAVAFGFDPQARADYGGASLKPVTEAARALIDAYYGRAPERSYFVGCSKGGAEGMYLAQRNPELFDGIIAAAPGFSLPRAAVAEAWDTQAFASLIDTKQKDSKSQHELLPATFSDEQFARVRTAVLAACDADDGLQDGITANWRTCTWSRVKPKLQQQVCANSPECLSDKQVAALARVYEGAKDSKGKLLYVDWALDGGVGSAGWRSWKIGSLKGAPGATGPFPGTSVAMGAPALAVIFTTPPTAVGSQLSDAFKYAMSFDFDRDAPKIYATDATFARSAWDDISARSPDVRAFRERGGKMIVPHGVSDPVFSINDTVSWYREVDRLNDGKAADFVRVFAVPGMAHCAGGPATDQYDAFDALVAWVEQGAPPERIVATAGPASPWPNRTRPLCPYPKLARYDGKGGIEEAASFRCE